MKSFFCLALLGFALAASPQGKGEDAGQLYNKAIQLIELGKSPQGRTILKEVMDKYPGTAYAKLAKESLDKPIVASITYKEVSPLSSHEIKKRLELANAQLMVGKLYQQEGVDQARNLIVALIVKKKEQTKVKDVLINAVDTGDHQMAVTIEIVKR
jgi:hypothetical protein